MRAADTPVFRLEAKPPLPPFVVAPREMSGLGSTVSLKWLGDVESRDLHLVTETRCR
jgi:hypothetical protein